MRCKAGTKNLNEAGTLLNHDLKLCTIRQDLQWGKIIHSKALEGSEGFKKYDVTALVKMYAKCRSIVNAHSVFDNILNPNLISWTALILGYAENGEGTIALDFFARMKEHGWTPDSIAYVAALKACTSLAMSGDANGCLQHGREVHLEVGSHLDQYVQNTLIDMYAKSASMEEARCVFDCIQEPDVVSWNALLLGYADNRQGHVALDLFFKMRSKCEPDSITYIAALKSCTCLAEHDRLDWVKAIHSQIGNCLNRYLQNTLIVTYAKCRSMADARGVFDSIGKLDVVSWNALILGYVEEGQSHAALELFSKMKSLGYTPDSVTYIAALKACGSFPVGATRRDKETCLQSGRVIHSEIGFCSDYYLQCTLIDMYAKCGSMLDARGVFDAIQKPNIACWNALLFGYIENQDGQTALTLFSEMNPQCPPNSLTYIAALKACTSMTMKAACTTKEKILRKGREIHSKVGSTLDRHVQATLVEMYAKCGSMLEARQVFDHIQDPDVVSWTSLLIGYVEAGEGLVALEMFSAMKACRYNPNSLTYLAALKACTSVALNGNGIEMKDSLERGREIHLEVGCHLDQYVQNTLIDMYSKCGSLVEAHMVFAIMDNRDVVSWTTLLLGYADSGDANTAIALFFRMKTCGCVPDLVTYIAALKACGSIGALSLGRKLHCEIFEFNSRVVTCLVDFYAKCGCMLEARQVFESNLKTRDLKTWTALFAGYSSLGDSEAVFALFDAMLEEELLPDNVTLLCLLLCCSHGGLVEKAKSYFEAMSVHYRVTPDLMHYNCMVDVLGRANKLNEAIGVIRNMHCHPDSVTWKTLLGACSKWKNLEIGRGSFQALKEIGKKDAGACLLMAQIYGSRGMWEEQKRCCN